MKAILPGILVLAVTLTGAAGTQAQNANPEPGAREAARRQVQELLQEKRVTLRVYVDCLADPCDYRIAQVATDGLALAHESVAAAVPGLSERSVLVCQGDDQGESGVRAALRDCLSVNTFQRGGRMALWSPAALNSGRRAWTFTDALGGPMANALVRIEVVVNREGAKIYLAHRSTDASGSLPRPSIVDPITALFTLSHPEYGAAWIETRQYEDGSLPAPIQTFVLPLARRGLAESPSTVVRGNILDAEGTPVTSAGVECTRCAPYGYWDDRQTRVATCTLTGHDGRFALNLPLRESDAPVWSQMRFLLSVDPPKRSNLRREQIDLSSRSPAAPLTVTLAALSEKKYFHTFAFEYRDGPVSDLQEVRRITLVLFRDGREWQWLRYEDFQNGCELPLGILRASTRRWDREYLFESIELTPASPRALTFRPPTPILYSGTVVYEDSGLPAKGVLVLMNHRLGGRGGDQLSPEEWQMLRSQAAQEQPNPSEELQQQWRERVSTTDENGRFQIWYVSEPNQYGLRFSALASGYAGNSSFVSRLQSSVEGIIEVQPAIRLLPTRSATWPQFVFEDESGPVTDPDKLNQLRITIVGAPEARGPYAYRSLLGNFRFIPGFYSATATWNGKVYTFGPVDLTKDRPSTIVFKPTQIVRSGITYRGQVIHGVTRQSISGALVFSATPEQYRFRPAALEPQQWDAIHKIGPDFEENHPALAPFRACCGSDRLTRTDANGWFEIVLAPQEIVPRTSLLAVEQDFLLGLHYWVVQPDEVTGGPSHGTDFQPNRMGVVSLPPLRLFPAGRIQLRPTDVEQDQFAARRRWVSLMWYPATKDATPWSAELFSTPMAPQASLTGTRGGARALLECGQKEIFLAPAGVPLWLRLVMGEDPTVAPILLGPVHLRPGEALDLGQCSFGRAVQVKVKVTDTAGQPVAGIPVGYRYAADIHTYNDRPRDRRTGPDGVCSVYLPPYTKGSLLASYFDLEEDKHVTEGVPYAIEGPEEQGKEFILPLSSAFLTSLLAHTVR